MGQREVNPEVIVFNPYLASIVCTMWYSDGVYAGVLDAKRVDSKEEAGNYMFDEILRLIENFGGSEHCDGSGKVTVESYRDAFGEWVTEVKCPDGALYQYKLIFDEEVKESGKGKDSETKEVSAEP